MTSCTIVFVHIKRSWWLMLTLEDAENIETSSQTKVAVNSKLNFVSKVEP